MLIQWIIFDKVLIFPENYPNGIFIGIIFSLPKDQGHFEKLLLDSLKLVLKIRKKFFRREFVLKWS